MLAASAVATGESFTNRGSFCDAAASGGGQSSSWYAFKSKDVETLGPEMGVTLLERAEAAPLPGARRDALLKLRGVVPDEAPCCGCGWWWTDAVRCVCDVDDG